MNTRRDSGSTSIDFAREVDDQANHLVVNASWLMRLRWVAVTGQLITIGVAWLPLNVTLPLLPLLAIVLFTGVTNLGLWFWLKRFERSPILRQRSSYGKEILAAILALDLASLTALLYYTGGPANPFSVFYLVNLALCAIVLPRSWGWALTGFAVVGFGWLLVFHVHLPELARPLHGNPQILGRNVTLADLGQFVAVATCAVVITHFVQRVIHQLELTQAELRRVEQERLRSEKLEALGTLAGGAAHELATPLSTIAVVANEMAHDLGRHASEDELREDMNLIRAEVDHCHRILQRLTGRAGQLVAEPAHDVPVIDLVKGVLQEMHSVDQVDLSLPKALEQTTVCVPRENLAQAMRAVLQNALDASGPQGRVALRVERQAEYLCWIVRDHGPGMDAETLARATDPFFTTKEPGRGMGLGLFLARSVVERLGGELRLESVLSQGVTVTMKLPC